MKTGIIIQARMGSSRLSGKVMLELEGKTVLQHVIDRVRQCKLVNEIIIATTDLKQDDTITEHVTNYGVKCFRGSETDVLSRYYFAALENNLDTVIRITSDCPLIDPQIVDKLIQAYKKKDYALLSNVSLDISNRTYPRGLDTEIFSFKVLEQAFYNASELYQREHVTPYIYEKFDNIYCFKNDIDYSKYRWTLDTDEDLQLIKEIYRHLYKGIHDFYLADIIKLVEKYPELVEINAEIEQKKIK